MTKWSDARIALIGAQASRFPKHEVLHWQALRSVPERARELIRAADEKMTQIENDKDLSADGVKNKRADVAREVLALGTLMETVESSVGPRQEKLREKVDAFLMEGAPKDPMEAQIGGEIRAHIARSESPAMTALRLKANKQAVAAVLGAPSFLSGLSEEEASAFRAQALNTNDRQIELIEIEKAVGICEAAIKSAEEMICERAKLRKRHDGTWEALQ
jgi:hypothetical protein